MGSPSIAPADRRAIALLAPLEWAILVEMTVTEQALRLDVYQRLDLIATLWDSLLDEGFDPPVSEQQRAELRRRLDEHRVDPSAVVTWAEAKRRLSRK